MMMEFIKKILLEKDHPGIQFLKYAFCGGLAFATDITIFYLTALFVFPALTPDDYFAQLLGLEIEPISESLRLKHFWLCKASGFVGGNIVAYVTNVLFVFKGGKHRILHEIALFLGVSFAAFLLSTWSGDALIRFFGVQTTVSNLTAIIFATLFNYTGRKFFIFHG
ncbi:GtrA family protein [Verrucomicrobia bacterium S94]|nr:GtrA family protein [Verrucomicrobia bacterium S94]